MRLQVVDMTGSVPKYNRCVDLAEDILLHVPQAWVDFRRQSSEMLGDEGVSCRLQTPVFLVTRVQYDEIKGGDGSIRETLGLFAPGFPFDGRHIPAIVMCMDAIADSARRSELPTEILFSKVLAHEMMHALFQGCDHSVNYHKQEFAAWIEEAYANAYALHIMEAAEDAGLIDKDHLRLLRDFVMKQDPQYAFGNLLHRDKYPVRHFFIKDQKVIDRCADVAKGAARDLWLDYAKEVHIKEEHSFDRDRYNSIMDSLNT